MLEHHLLQETFRTQEFQPQPFRLAFHSADARTKRFDLGRRTQFEPTVAVFKRVSLEITVRHVQ